MKNYISFIFLSPTAAPVPPLFPLTPRLFFADAEWRGYFLATSALCQFAMKRIAGVKCLLQTLLRNKTVSTWRNAGGLFVDLGVVITQISDFLVSVVHMTTNLAQSTRVLIKCQPTNKCIPGKLQNVANTILTATYVCLQVVET